MTGRWLTVVATGRSSWSTAPEPGLRSPGAGRWSRQLVDGQRSLVSGGLSWSTVDGSCFLSLVVGHWLFEKWSTTPATKNLACGWSWWSFVGGHWLMVHGLGRWCLSLVTGRRFRTWLVVSGRSSRAVVDGRRLCRSVWHACGDSSWLVVITFSTFCQPLRTGTGRPTVQ